MSESNTFENSQLLLLYNNTDIAGIGDATGLRGSPGAGSFFFSLHTGDPGEAGGPSTSEATYTGYARLAVARTSGGFTVTGASVANAALAEFAACTGGTNTITHFGVCSASSGGILIGSGALTSSIAISNGITPRFAAAAFTHTKD